MNRVAPARSLVLGLAISVSFLALLVNQVDVRKSWNVLAGIDLRLMLLPAATQLSSQQAALALHPLYWSHSQTKVVAHRAEAPRKTV